MMHVVKSKFKIIDFLILRIHGTFYISLKKAFEIMFTLCLKSLYLSFFYMYVNSQYQKENVYNTALPAQRMRLKLQLATINHKQNIEYVLWSKVSTNDY